MKLWLKIGLWSFFLAGIAFLLVHIAKVNNERLLTEPEIVIHVSDENTFLTPKELYDQLKNNQLLFDGQKREQLDPEKIESFILGISQVKSAEVFMSVGDHWKIEVELRTPVARVYNTFGESFYIDVDGNIMETTSYHTARVLVITGAIKDRLNSVPVADIINSDSLISIRKLDDIYRISAYVCYDPLLRSLVGQIHLEKNGDFILVPLVGDQKIVFGSAASEKEVEKKFEKLRIFYQEGMSHVSWDTYSEINLKFEDQIVCKNKQSDRL